MSKKEPWNPNMCISKEAYEMTAFGFIKLLAKNAFLNVKKKIDDKKYVTIKKQDNE